MKIRPCSPADSDAVSRLSGQLGYPANAEDVQAHLREIQQDVDHCLLVLEGKDSAVAGWIHVFKTKRAFTPAFAEIGGLVVDESSRGTGIGRKLLAAAEEWALEHGCKRMLVRSRVTRTLAHHFYEDAGYEVLKTQAVFQKEI
jgi:GNAT superfamily N-acetyltransferase